jgi:hypothetical protein
VLWHGGIVSFMPKINFKPLSKICQQRPTVSLDQDFLQVFTTSYIKMNLLTA